MPAVHADYDTAYALRLKGFSYNEIAKRTGIDHERLMKYGKRHGWDEVRTKAVQAVSEHVQDALCERAKSHVEKISGFADRAIDALMLRDLETMQLDDMQTLASVANTFDQIARRTYGLDKEQSTGRPTLALQVNVNGQATPEVRYTSLQLEQQAS